MSSADLIQQGIDLRERGQLPQALKILGQAVNAAAKEKDFIRMITALGERGLVWKHFHLETKDRAFLVLARKDIEAMQLISELKSVDIKRHTISFLLGQTDMLLGDFKNAIINFRKALRIFKGLSSEKGDWRYHLGEAYYKAGDKEKGKKTIFEGIEEIKKGSEEAPKFLCNVWLSGAFMRLADLLRLDEPKEAKKYLGQAEDIIDKTKGLVMRRRQLQRLKRKF